jgi:hypothetical protein
VSAINFATVTDFDHHDQQVGVVQSIENPVIALAHTILFTARELFAARGPGGGRKSLNPSHNALPVLWGKGLDFFGR